MSLVEGDLVTGTLKRACYPIKRWATRKQKEKITIGKRVKKKKAGNRREGLLHPQYLYFIWLKS